MSTPIYIPDTHCLIWRMTNSPQLGLQAKAILTLVDQGRARLLIPTLVIAELLYYIERRNRQLPLQSTLQHWQANPMIEILPLSFDTVMLMQQATTIPEMHDRLIACEAFLRKATLLTVDRSIVASGFVPTIW